MQVSGIVGKPDFVFGQQRKVIFVHGCFWHRHRCRRGQSLPSTRIRFWRSKFERNRERDKLVLTKLKSDGWSVLVVWECQLRYLEVVRGRLREFLRD